MNQEANLQLVTRYQWDRIVQLLSRDPAWLHAKVQILVPAENLGDLGSGDKEAEPHQRVVEQLQKLYGQGAATWRKFIHCLCMEQSLPLDLEVPLLSTWGQDEGYLHAGETEEGCPLESQPHTGLKRHHQNWGASLPRKRSRKQQLELTGTYMQRLRTAAQQRCRAAALELKGPLGQQQVHVPPILQWSRSTAPLHSREVLTPGVPLTEDGPYGSLQDLFPPRTSKGPRVTVLLGQAGMGKTTLAWQLCRTWASGQLERFQALFLFEFRLLNLLPRPLTLTQLLLDAALSPEADPSSVLQYLEERAQSVLLIFDGLDEAAQPGLGGPEAAGSALALFSDLCQGTLLPGCQIMATSRPGKLPACLPRDAVLVHLWGFDGPRVDEYVGQFFSDQASREMALAELRAHGRVPSLRAVPALCHLACLCLSHPLPSCSADQPAALPPTVTQMYLQLVMILSPQRPLPTDSLQGLGKVALRGLEAGMVIFSKGDIHPSLITFGTAHSLLTLCYVCIGPGHWEPRYAFPHLCLQEFFAALYLMVSSTVGKEELARHVVLYSRWVLRTVASPRLSDSLSTFLAGLASPACRPFLSRLAQKDEAWLGLRQAAVVQELKTWASRSLTGPKVVELCHCIEETQEAELARFSAQTFRSHLCFHNFPLTYADLAAMTSVLGHRDEPIHLEFEGCPLEPCSPRVLAGCEKIECLSFKSRKCGDTFAEALSSSLPTMGRLRKLGLSGSKITACGIGCLLKALPLCQQLEEICFQDNQFKDQEVLDMAEGLLSLPRLQKLDLSRNIVSVATLLRLTKVAVTSPAVRMLQVREADLVFLLTPPTEASGDLPGAPDHQETASQKKETQSLSVRLQKCHLRVHDVEILVAHLQRVPELEEVDLSGNDLEDEGCRLMVEAAAQLGTIRKLNLSNNKLSRSGLHCVLQAASRCQTLLEVNIRLFHGTVVFTFAPELRERERSQIRDASLHSPQTPSELPPCRPQIRLAHCGLYSKHLAQLCRALGRSCHWGDLDLSNNALGDVGMDELAQLLPSLGPLLSVDLSKNNMSLKAALVLAKCFSTLPWPLLLDINLKSQRVILRGDRRDRTPGASGSSSVSALPAGTAGSRLSSCVPRSFCLEECELEPRTLRILCSRLEPCPGPLEVRLSCKGLSAESLEALLQCLPRMSQLSLLQLSQAEVLSPQSPLLLANLFGLSPRIQKVDLRSLRHLTLNFRSIKEPDGGCYVRFQDCSLGPEHLETLYGSLNKCSDLRELDLSANQLGDAGVHVLLAQLSRMPLSGLLDLSQNSLSQEAVLGLMDVLPTCPRVREASVCLGSENSFRVHMDPQEETGKTLRLSQCSLLQDHMLRMASSLNQVLELTDITLTHCNLGPGKLITLLRLMTRQTPLSLRVTEPWVIRVKILLQVCAKDSGKITGVSLVGSQQQLHLQLESPPAENPGAHRSADWEAETPPRLASKPCARLQQLRLSQVKLSEEACQLLNYLLPPSGLRSFWLTWGSVSSLGLQPLVSALGNCHQLEELDLSNCELNAKDVPVMLSVLVSKHRLKRLRLSYLTLGTSALDVLTQALEHMTLLQSLWLDGCSLGNLGCSSLAMALEATPGLEELRLSQNRIGDEGVQHVAALLPKLPELRKLDLSKNALGLAGGGCMAKSLVLCRQLEELRLGFNDLREPTMLVLAQGLSQKLRILHLQSIHLGPAGVLSLVQALDGHPCVEEISLAQNSLTGSLPPLREGLPRLRQLDLVSCDIDDQAAASLAASLRLCPVLEEVLLSWNQLGDHAAAELAQILPLMDRLKEVDLERNRITAHGAQLLATGLAQGSRVQVIRLWSNSVPEDVALRLQREEPRLRFAFFDNQPPVPGDS